MHVLPNLSSLEIVSTDGIKCSEYEFGTYPEQAQQLAAAQQALAQAKGRMLADARQALAQATALMQAHTQPQPDSEYEAREKADALVQAHTQPQPDAEYEDREQADAEYGDPDKLGERIYDEAFREWEGKSQRERIDYYNSLSNHSGSFGTECQEHIYEEIKSLFEEWGVNNVESDHDDEDD